MWLIVRCAQEEPEAINKHFQTNFSLLRFLAPPDSKVEKRWDQRPWTWRSARCGLSLILSVHCIDNTSFSSWILASSGPYGPLLACLTENSISQSKIIYLPLWFLWMASNFKATPTNVRHIRQCVSDHSWCACKTSWMQSSTKIFLFTYANAMQISKYFQSRPVKFHKQLNPKLWNLIGSVVVSSIPLLSSFQWCVLNGWPNTVQLSFIAIFGFLSLEPQHNSSPNTSIDTSCSNRVL